MPEHSAYTPIDIFFDRATGDQPVDLRYLGVYTIVSNKSVLQNSKTREFNHLIKDTIYTGWWLQPL